MKPLSSIFLRIALIVLVAGGLNRSLPAAAAFAPSALSGNEPAAAFAPSALSGYEPAAAPAPSSASAVTTQGRQIYVDGAPFKIRGVGYAPTPLGDDPDLPGAHGDYFTISYQDIYERDLPLLRNLGANTIRLWGWDASADHTDFLNQLYHQGSQPIYVMVSYWINGGQNLSDSTVRQTIRDGFSQMVTRHKDNPAVLMWLIGNELNGSWMYGNSDALFSLINEMAQDAHQIEGANYHPVTTPLADSGDLIGLITQRDAQMTALDVWSVQLYRGDSFGNFFAQYAAASSKPLVLTEYGIDAYDSVHGAEYEAIGAAQQALYDAALWNEIAASDVAAGGSLMAYSDEWWKGKYGETSAGCPESNPNVHSACGYNAGGHPDGFANEEWWGLMRPVKNASGPDTLQPRAAYTTLRAIWTEKTQKLFVPVVTH